MIGVLLLRGSKGKIIYEKKSIPSELQYESTVSILMLLFVVLMLLLYFSRIHVKFVIHEDVYKHSHSFIYNVRHLF